MKEHLFWVIKDRIEVCILDGVAAIDFMGPTVFRDIGLVDKWERKNKQRFIDSKSMEDYWKITKELRDYILKSK